MQPIARLGLRAASTAAVAGGKVSVLRSWGPIGFALRDRASTVKASQEVFARKTGPTYRVRGADDNITNGVFLLMGINTILFVAGLKDILTGTNKKH